MSKFTMTEFSKNIGHAESLLKLESHLKSINDIETELNSLTSTMADAKQTLLTLLDSESPNYEMISYIASKLKQAMFVQIEQAKVLDIMKNPMGEL